MEGTTKRCGGCGIVKPVEEFYFRNRARSERQPFCRPCKSRYNRAWYQRNREKHIEDVRRNTARYRAEAREYVEGLKRQPCADCGGRFPSVAMDFDHIDPTTKARDISRMVRFGASIRALRREIDKCELVCSNCHRLRTEAQRRRRGFERGTSPIPAPGGPHAMQVPRQMRLL